MSTTENQPSPAEPAPQESVRRPRRWRRRLLRLTVALVAMLVIAEFVLRFKYGLGDPPLVRFDPKMEYIQQPNQTLRRFNNYIHYNAYSMRADDFPPTKSSPDELRIFAIGDSVINGGVQTDQADLATSIIQRELSAKLNRKVIVGNASASSWGPGNELEYMKQYPDLLQADILLIVMSSHDVVDVPTFEPVVNVALDMPDHKPLCALSELVMRYIVPRVKAKMSGGTVWPAQTPQAPDNPDVIRSLAELREMIEMGRAAGARVIVAQAVEHREANGHLQPGHDMIRDVATAAGADIVDFAAAFDAELNAGRDPWRDQFYHPNSHGQRIMANVLIPVLENGEKKE